MRRLDFILVWISIHKRWVFGQVIFTFSYLSFLIWKMEISRGCWEMMFSWYWLDLINTSWYYCEYCDLIELHSIVIFLRLIRSFSLFSLMQLFLSLCLEKRGREIERERVKGHTFFHIDVAWRLDEFEICLKSFPRGRVEV